MADDDLSDLEIAVLCDLLEGPRANLKAYKWVVLNQLVAKGLVEPAKDDPAKFQLSDKAHHLLADALCGNKRWLAIAATLRIEGNGARNVVSARLIKKVWPKLRPESLRPESEPALAHLSARSANSARKCWRRGASLESGDPGRSANNKLIQRLTLANHHRIAL
jgi:hypothetical protein